MLLAACVFLLLSLFSFDSGDAGWSRSGPETHIGNWMGPVGAWLSDVLYSLFGASALWWPAMLGFAAWRLLRARHGFHLEWDATALAVRGGGLVLLLLGTTTLGALHFYRPSAETVLPYSSGGILGEGLVGALVPMVGSGGAGLLALSALLCGLPLLTGLSWLLVMDELGYRAMRFWGWLSERFAFSRAPALERNEAQPEAETTDPEQEPSAHRPRWWRRLLPGVGPRRADGEAEPSSRLEPGFGNDGATEIPWEVPEKTPSAKQPGAAYSERQPADAGAAAGTAAKAATNAAAHGATRTDGVATRASAHRESLAVTDDETFAAASSQAPRPRAAETVPEPMLPDDDEPATAWSGPSLRASRDEESVDSSPALTPDAPTRTAALQPPEPEEAAGEEAEDPGQVEKTPDAAPRLATADQGREAADEDGMRLWTVEHLQSQRPVLDDMPEPEGELPSLRLLTPPEPQQQNYTLEQLAEMAELLEVRLREYGVKAEVVDTWPGPVITRFEIRPAAGVKVSKISNLAKDLARSLMVKSVRVVEVIPGRPTVGIEIPNPHRAMIRLREVIDSDRYQQADSALTLALGQDIGGGPVVANLGKMPHLLVAGTTGSGKSVGVNAMLISMLLKATPEQLRLIMVDPKMLELSVYDGIPHLLAPVVTDMKEAANALRWCVAEMERRYKLMATMGVRNIAGFNAKLDEAKQAGAQVADPLWEPQPWEMHQSPPVLEKLPYIVVVIDEFADMFMIVGKKVEELIARLAQKARAAGIHLILATQRPSVDVVTGLIKANIPTRMAFQVSSRIDSRTILDQGGAENLLGHGDMLYLPAGSGLPTRVHGAFVDDDEVHRVVEDWKRRGEPEYIDEILSGGVSAEALTGLEAEGSGDGDDAEQDALYDEAVQFVIDSRRASISAVQRRFKIGYNRAARLVEAMEMAGVVTSMGTNGSREVLAPRASGD